MLRLRAFFVIAAAISYATSLRNLARLPSGRQSRFTCSPTIFDALDEASVSAVAGCWAAAIPGADKIIVEHANEGAVRAKRQASNGDAEARSEAQSAVDEVAP